MSGSREDRSKSPDPPVGNEWNLRRTNNPEHERSHFSGSTSRHRTSSTSKLSNNVQPTPPGPSAIENSRAKSSSTSSSSRKSKEEKRSGPSDECEGEDEDSTGISLEGYEELSATEGKDQSFSTDMRRGSRKVTGSGEMIDERDDTIKYLETELAKSRAETDKLRGRIKERRETYREMGEQYGEAKKSRDAAEKSVRELQQRNGDLERAHIRVKEALEGHKRHITELNRDYGEVQEAMKGQNEQITELTKTISLFGGRSSTTTRDDDYFEGEFSKLAGAIQQWIMRCFRGPSDVKFQDLPQTVQDSLRDTIFNDGSHEPEIKLKEIEAVVVHQLTRAFFGRSPFSLPWDEHLYRSFHNVFELLRGTDLETRKWHAQTVDMILNDSRYEECFSRGVEKVTKDLGGLLHIRVTGGANREKELFTIVEQAGRLSEEINRQVALFQLHRIDLAIPYDPEVMEDRSGLLDDEEKEQHGKNRGIVVQKVLFPVVLRYGFDDEGKFLRIPVVVRKGTVVVMRPTEDGAESHVD
ncbi:hypothetical protein Q9L58_009173 [Maublancomyces gigas]|uniref:Uncharacterized protein n=1 Tax=Discina gigas TaxID=1032678 RepID=A0ABR3G8P0_9PEZI